MKGNKPRSVLGAPGPLSLAIVAGLPAGVAGEVVRRVEADHATWKVVSTPFARRPADAFTRERSVLDLMLQSSFFAETRSRREGRVPSPKRILLLYVGLPGHAHLLRAFGHSVLPIRLEAEDWAWGRGAHWRFDVSTAAAAVSRAIRASATGRLMALHERLLTTDPDEVLRLPGRNFLLPGGHRLASRFERFASGEDGVDEIGADIASRVFTKDRLRAFYEAVGSDRQRFCVDDRGLVFCISPRGQHGPPRVLGDQERGSIAALRSFLERSYRFGTPLRPGFQHDVQWEGDRPLHGEVFECVDKGAIAVSGSHANVYANDHVRE